MRRWRVQCTNYEMSIWEGWHLSVFDLWGKLRSAHVYALGTCFYLIFFIHPTSQKCFQLHLQYGETNLAGLTQVSCCKSTKPIQSAIPGLKVATRANKSRAMPTYAPGDTPPGWPLISVTEVFVLGTQQNVWNRFASPWILVINNRIEVNS